MAIETRIEERNGRCVRVTSDRTPIIDGWTMKPTGRYVEGLEFVENIGPASSDKRQEADNG